MSKPTWITTFSGRAFDLGNPDPSAITVRDIAHHLSLLCRYTGACRQFYSVAQHSCLVAELLPARLKLAGLLHDAAEAYTGDWSSPMKALVRELAPGLIEHVHNNVERAVEERFGLRLSREDHAAIKHADLVAMATEKRDLMPPDPQPGWCESTGLVELPAPLNARIHPLSSLSAELNFDLAFKQYRDL